MKYCIYTKFDTVNDGHRPMYKSHLNLYFV
jgi:hypothetical protein